VGEEGEEERRMEEEKRKEGEEGIVKEAEIDWDDGEGRRGEEYWERREWDVGEGEEERRCIPHRNGRRWKDLKII